MTEKGIERMPFVIGLTGNIATGKSSILQYMAEKGVHVIDADKLAHRAMEPGGPAYAAIVETFGETILAEDGRIDRKALGGIVFSDPAALRRLEAISHPAVVAMARCEIRHSEARFALIEAIKLLEGKTRTLCNEIWVVTSPPETQLQRLMEHRALDRETAQQRMNAQPPQSDKVRQADRVLRNDGSLAELHAQLDVAWADLQKKVL